MQLAELKKQCHLFKWKLIVDTRPLAHAQDEMNIWREVNVVREESFSLKNFKSSSRGYQWYLFPKNHKFLNVKKLELTGRQGDEYYQVIFMQFKRPYQLRNKFHYIIFEILREKPC